MQEALYWLDLLGVAVFAASGALTASRKQMDIFGFALVATVTGIGGGTLRDLLLGIQPVFWINDPAYPLTCVAIAVIVYFTAHLVESRFRTLLWADALGVAMFCITGAAIALAAGAPPVSAVILGTVTATFGGLTRDVLCNEIPLILRREIYATAAAAGATVFVVLDLLGSPGWLDIALAFTTALALRGAALSFGLYFPVYKTRPGRDYSDDGS
ncbi:trimeric intracellular cation channel family protein [Fodinicurvata sediminis]|uniref:trimeric intracellular cation channel family protein n=1 Tax=Fodinicurvata sediminis TaxID=1121832 RepID=UPI0003B6D72F|nr:trimeric intracellular cation channel family protein [Fodinicurvata sediminis]